MQTIGITDNSESQGQGGEESGTDFQTEFFKEFFDKIVEFGQSAGKKCRRCRTHAASFWETAASDGRRDEP